MLSSCTPSAAAVSLMSSAGMTPVVSCRSASRSAPSLPLPGSARSSAGAAPPSTSPAATVALVSAPGWLTSPSEAGVAELACIETGDVVDLADAAGVTAAAAAVVVEGATTSTLVLLLKPLLRSGLTIDLLGSHLSCRCGKADDDDVGEASIMVVADDDEDNIGDDGAPVAMRDAAVGVADTPVLVPEPVIPKAALLLLYTVLPAPAPASGLDLSLPCSWTGLRRSGTERDGIDADGVAAWAVLFAVDRADVGECRW